MGTVVAMVAAVVTMILFRLCVCVCVCVFFFPMVVVEVASSG